MSKTRTEYMRSYRAEKKQGETEATKLLAEITRSYKANRRLIEEAMEGLNKGTAVYLQHCNSLAKLDRAHREELVERGLTPQNLGLGVTAGWVFKAIIGKDGTPTTIEVKPGEAEPQNEPRRLRECAECRKRVISELEAEFPSDVPAIVKKDEESE